MTYLRTHGLDLINRGYHIVPIKAGSKRPSIAGWQNVRAQIPHLDDWLSRGFKGAGVLTHNTPAIDLDILDDDVAGQMSSFVEKMLPEAPRRTGLAPKTLYVCKTDAPFTKMASRAYEDFLGCVHRVEILGSGQQFVAFAEHPDTKKPYDWHGRPLSEIDRDDLPELTLQDAQEIIAYFESIVPDDWELVQDAKNSAAAIDDGLTPELRVLNNYEPPLDISLEQIKDALAATAEHCDGRDSWYKAGMALYHQFEGGSDGFALWDEWSAQSVKYKAGETERLWTGFEVNLQQTRPVTFATVLHWAKEAKAKAQRTDKTGKVYKSKVERFVAQYIYVEDGDRVCDLAKPPQHCLSRLSEFRNATSNVRHEVPAPTKSEPDKVKFEPVHQAWLVNSKRGTARGAAFDPKQGRVFADQWGLNWINEAYMPEFAHTKEQYLITVFTNHMEYLFPVAREREWFINWLAFNLQRPEVRCKVTPLHVSVAHGTGRGWVVELLGKLLGPWNNSQTKMSVLSGEGSGGAYHDYLHNSLLCSIGEVRESGKRYSVSDAIRDLLTEPRLELNLKYGSKGTRDVYTNFFMMSNHTDALVLSAEDRRINVFRGPDVPMDEAYYTRLYAWLETDGLGQLYWYLMRRDLTNFDWHRSMDTQARREMIANNRSETETAFWELMEDLPAHVMSCGQIIKALEELSGQTEFDSTIDKRQVTKLLQQQGKQWNEGKQIRVDGRIQRPWVLGTNRVFSNDEARAEMQKCGF